MKFYWPGLVLALVLAGCATGPKIDWASRVGHYTYDQAVLELGPPDKVAKLDNGIIVANWITRPGYAYTSVGPPVAGYYPGGPLAPNYTTGFSPTYFLRLTFGEDGNLTEWKKYTQ